MAQLDAEGISARIREARLKAGLTQEQLADLLHVHKKTVENYEHGSINYRALNQIAGIVNRTVEWLLHGDQPATLEVTPEQMDVLAARVEEVLAEVRGLRELVEPLVEARRPKSPSSPPGPQAN